MRNSPLRRNRVFVLAATALGAVTATVASTGALFRSLAGRKNAEPVPRNRLLDAVHFLLVSGPKHFWKKPTGIAAGRSVGTFLHFLLEKEIRFAEKRDGKKGFTLVETMLAISILAVLFIAAFEAFGQIGFFRTKINNRMDLSQDLYYNVEKLAALVKDGGTIDYEEYFGRQAVGTAMNAGHYSVPSGFWNYGGGGAVGTATWWSDPYFCRSGNGTSMGTGGCLAAFNTAGSSQAGQPQRYGQYARMFKDLNSNANGDGGDEDGVGGYLGDDDDEDLGAGPVSLSFSGGVPELYLTKNGLNPERLALRWRVEEDPDRPSVASCDVANATGSGCIGRLEMLRLVGHDFGMAHSGSVASTGRYDGVIDTWACREDFRCLGPENTPSGTGAEWVSVFPSDIDVSAIRFFPWPEKNPALSWKENDPGIRSAPYVRIEMTLGLSWARKKKSTVNDVRTNIVTTVALNP